MLRDKPPVMAYGGKSPAGLQEFTPVVLFYCWHGVACQDYPETAQDRRTEYIGGRS
jgi:hypothetical protein